MIAVSERVLGSVGPLVDGAWIDGTSGGDVEHVDPATGRVNGSVHLAGAEEADAAIAAAEAALPSWRALPGDERRRILQRVEQLVEDDAEELARLTTLELGHPLAVGRAQARICSAWFGYYAGWADKIEGTTIPLTPGNNVGFDYTLREPYGVVGIIITWNGPLASLGMKVAPALAAGNCVVLKTPELAPYAAARFAELALEAGVPHGVLHVLPGGPEPGERIVRHPSVARISFTGGHATAVKILEAAALSVKPVVLELGGKSANIVFPDADLAAALGHAFGTCFGLAGQECAFPSRLLVHEDLYDEVVERASGTTGRLIVGDPFDAATNVGPLVNEHAVERILATVAAAPGRVVAGGRRAAGLPDELASGYYVEPTVVADVDAASSLAREEVFGPVLAVLRFGTEEEAVRIANSTDYGLAATVHTRDVARVHRIAPQLAAGSVRFNGGLALPPGAPFGGYKRSGVGREGGKAGLDEFLQTKNVFVKL